MEFTGERMIPEHNEGSEIYYEHIVRYIFASRYVQGKSVIDIACGSGYGTVLLKEKGATQVTGIDISAETVRYAKEKYIGIQGLEFIEGSALDIPLADASVDVVVSFETIEHIPNPYLLLKEARRILKDDGILVVSTPIKGNYPAGNPYHLEEFTIEEFTQLLKKEFAYCSLLHQEKVSSQILYSSPAALEKLPVYTAEGFVHLPWYQVWVCSNKEFVNTEGISLMKEDGDLRDYKQAVSYLEHVVEARDKELKEVKEHREELLDGIIFRDKQIIEAEKKRKIYNVCGDIANFPTYDIIIPVYNGYEFLKDCVESVLTKTNYPSYRIILIDDCSTDMETVGYMIEMSELHEHVVYIRQQENGGFVHSVNTGMEYSEHDVVLLNSDTVVTENWLLQMHKCRTEVSSVGSITPLTNNGTICSVPRWLEDNELPQGVSVDEMAVLVHRSSLFRYPTLPTAVGFCMLIPRTVVTQVGLFDEETFGRGYGEENDWCMRAMALGYQHYLDDGTFVQHKGSMTFGKDSKKQALLEENLQKLAKKHPTYLPMVEKFIKEDSLRDIIDNVQLHLEFTNGKKNILMVLHRDVRGAVGGTELHVDHLARHFSETYNVFIAFPDIAQGRIVIGLYGGQQIIREFFFPIVKRTTDSVYYQESVMEIFRNFLLAARIGLVHIHHLLDWPLRLSDVCRDLDIPYVMTLHDYFFYCQCPQLLYGFEQEFCEYSQDKQKCVSCMKSNPYFRKIPASFQMLETRRKVIADVLTYATQVIVPSRYLRDAVVKYLGIPATAIDVIPHAVEYCTKRSQHQEVVADTKKSLRVAFLGAFSVQKGSRLFAELVLHTSHPHIEFVLIGAIGDKESFERIKKKVTYAGTYRRSDVSKLLHTHGVDVVVLPSIWPETFAYTLSEALESGIKVITTTLGAQKERVLNLQDSGWLFDVKTWVRETRTLLHQLWDEKSVGKSLEFEGKVDATLLGMWEKYGRVYRSTTLPLKKEYKQKFLLDAVGSIYPVQGSRNNLSWKDYLYLFLVKTRMIVWVRPLFFKLRGIFIK